MPQCMSDKADKRKAITAKDYRLSARIPASDGKEIEAIALKEDRTVSYVVQKLISEALARKKR